MVTRYLKIEWGLIKSSHTGKVLDIAGGRASPGTKVISYGCHGGDNQLWRYTSDGHILSKLGLALSYIVS
jgi:hypothetical protein